MLDRTPLIDSSRIKAKTYRATVKHAAGDLTLWWKIKTFILQFPIRLSEISEFKPSLCSQRPALNQFQHLLFDFVVERDAIGFQKRNQIVHEFARRNFGEKMGTPNPRAL